MRVIVLGSTGYLGSRVIKELISRNHQVLCLIRTNSNMQNLSDILDRVDTCLVEDLPQKLEQMEEKYDVFFNAACRYARADTHDAEIFEANMNVPLKTFLTCVQHGVNRHITVGTGLPDEFNVYTVSKHEFATLGKWYCNRLAMNNRNIQFLNIELENYYGKDEPKERFLPSTIEKLKRDEPIMLTEGTQKRDFVYIDDVSSILVKLIEQYPTPGYVNIPLGTGEGVAVRDVIKYLKEITNSKSELCFGAVPKRLYEPDSIADCTVLQELGLYAQYDWKTGMKFLI
ncbi:MAG: NAD(P)-dependent oxidoreductase [Lachnospiraceae bacterium]|nr:NAD(P)-dependent oxidoreductase [Lachnospiraceae bacterium]